MISSYPWLSSTLVVLQNNSCFFYGLGLSSALIYLQSTSISSSIFVFANITQIDSLVSSLSSMSQSILSTSTTTTITMLSFSWCIAYWLLRVPLCLQAFGVQTFQVSSRYPQHRGSLSLISLQLLYQSPGVWLWLYPASQAIFRRRWYYRFYISQSSFYASVATTSCSFAVCLIDPQTQQCLCPYKIYSLSQISISSIQLIYWIRLLQYPGSSAIRSMT